GETGGRPGRRVPYARRCLAAADRHCGRGGEGGALAFGRLPARSRSQGVPGRHVDADAAGEGRDRTVAARGDRVPDRGQPLVRALCRAYSRRRGEGSGLRLALGIDAAWTATEPSGVALAQETATGWRLLA